MPIDNRNFYASLVRIHVLHHAAEQPIYGQWMIDELARHGYRLSAGTLYPMLHVMERNGFLKSTVVLSNGKSRRLYRATPLGRKALRTARRRVQQLFSELFEES
jgi:DNA-binding PadR family transcriptional regulator